MHTKFIVSIKSTKTLKSSQEINHVFLKPKLYGIGIEMYENVIDPANNYFDDGVMRLDFDGTLGIEKHQAEKQIEVEAFAYSFGKKADKDVTFIIGETEIKVYFLIKNLYLTYKFRPINVFLQLVRKCLKKC